MTFILATEIDSENPTIGDLKIHNGDFVFFIPEKSSRDEYSQIVAQRVKCRWQTIMGEWFLDQRKGVPYRTKIWGKRWSRVGLQGVANILSDVAAKTPGVQSVGEMSFSHQGDTFVVDNFDIYLDNGESVSIQGFDTDWSQKP